MNNNPLPPIQPARPRRMGVLAVTVGLVLLLTAACGSSASSSGSTPSTGTGGTSALADELAYAQCMRTHGVANYPDPGANGQEPNDAKQIARSNPRSQAASQACIHLLPNGGQAPSYAQVRGDYVRFAQCMRSHGTPNFPDPTIDSSGRPIFNLSTVGLSSEQLRTTLLAKAQQCQTLLHLTQLPNYES